MNFNLHRNPRRVLAALTLTLAACLFGSAAHAQTAPPAAPPAAPAAVAPVVAAPAPVVAVPVSAAPVAPAPALPAAPDPAPGAVVVAPPARRPEEETPGATPGAQPGSQRVPLSARIAALFSGAGPAQLQAQIMSLTTERDTLRQQLTTITAERDTLRGELNAVEQTLNAQQNVVRATAAEISTTVGIPQNQLPAPVTQEAAKGSVEDLKQQLKTERDSHKRAEIMQQIIKLERKASEAGANA